MLLRIEEAMARYRCRHGEKLKKQQLAAALFPDSSEAVQRQCLGRLISGRYSRINPDWVPVICRVCDCSADYLFNMSEE